MGQKTWRCCQNKSENSGGAGTGRDRGRKASSNLMPVESLVVVGIMFCLIDFVSTDLNFMDIKDTG